MPTEKLDYPFQSAAEVCDQPRPMASDYSLQSLLQGLFEGALRPFERQDDSRLNAKTAEIKEKERLHTQLLQGKEVKHDTLLETGRLLSVAYQPHGQAQPATASVSMLVQPTQAASLRCGVYTAEGSGVGSACLEGSADFSRHSGVDLELEVEQGSAWRGEASITHRLLNLPLTMRHGVAARQRSSSKRQQHPDRLSLNKKTAVTIPLPGTAAEVQASLDVPCAVSLPRRPSDNTMAGSSTYGSPSSAGAACWDDNALLPVSASTSSIELLLPPPAMWGPAAPEASPSNRRKVSLRVQPRGGRKPPPKPAKLQQEQYPSQQPAQREGTQQQAQQPKGGRSCVPQLTVDMSLPEDWGHESCRIPVQDVSCSWRQAWGQRVSTSLRWQHVAVGGGGSRRQGGRGGAGKASGQAEVPVGSSSSSSETSLNSSQAGSSAASGGSSMRSSLESEVGASDEDLSKAAPLGVPAALLAVPGRGAGGALGGGTSLFSPSTSLAAAAAAAADAAPSAAEPAAWPSTWPKLQAELKCDLGSRVTATANAALDSGGLGRPWREWREPGTGHIKSAGVKLKFKLGSIGGKGGDGSSSSSSGSKHSGGGKRSVTFQSSYNNAGLTHTVQWQHGSRDNPQRARSEVKLQCQPRARKASLDFEFYVPL